MFSKSLNKMNIVGGCSRPLYYKSTAFNVSSRLFSNSRLNFQEATKEEKKAKFDKSLLKPLFFIIVFTSMLNNVTEQRKKNSELEKRYEKKLEKYDELINRVKTTGQTNIDLNSEFKLINKMFERSENFSFNPSIPNAKVYNLKEENEEDLSQLFSDIMNDADKTLEELEADAKINNVELTKDDINDEEIVTNKEFLHRENQIEQNMMNSYKADTAQHILVEKSGDYANAPESTKVKKFL